MEKGLFYLPCGNNVDDMPPSFEGWYNPHQRWNGWYAPLFNKETYDKICAYYSDPKTNTQESIDDLKEFMDADKNKSAYSVSNDGSFFLICFSISFKALVCASFSVLASTS